MRFCKIRCVIALFSIPYLNVTMEGQPLPFMQIDAHNHILPYVDGRNTDFNGGARAAIKAMKDYLRSTDD